MDMMIVVPELSGNGGMESVIRMLGEGLAYNDIEYKIYIASKKRRYKHADTAWLNDLSFVRRTSVTKEKWVYILYHAAALARIIRRTGVKWLVATGTRQIMICRLAVLLSRTKPRIYFWPHRSIHTFGSTNYIKMADRYLAISQGIAKQLKKLGVSSEHIHTVYNPVPDYDTVKIPVDVSNIIFVGRLEENQKRISDLLYAMSGLTGGWKLHLLGSGADGQKLVRLASSLGITDKVVFHGFQPHVWRYIKRNVGGVGALVLPSRWEGFPMVLLEAMACGIFCISSDCETGPSEVVIDGINGMLYPVGEVASLAAALEQVLRGLTNHDQEQIRATVMKFGAEEYVYRFTMCLKDETIPTCNKDTTS